MYKYIKMIKSITFAIPEEKYQQLTIQKLK